MSERTNDEIVGNALARVNEMRGEHGACELSALPSGIVDGENCPIARALNFGSCRAVVSGEVYGSVDVDILDHKVVTNYSGECAIGEFVEAFDDGRLPDYETDDLACA